MKAFAWDAPFRSTSMLATLQLEALSQILAKKVNTPSPIFNRLSSAEQNYSANGRELPGLMYFLQRFRCYLRGSKFEVLTDNQDLRSFFTKPRLSRREARWLKFLANFVITKLTLVNRKVHVLYHALSRAPHISASNMEAKPISIASYRFNITLPKNMAGNYQQDQIFDFYYNGLQSRLPEDEIQREKLHRMLPAFQTNNNLLYHKRKLYVPRQNVKDSLWLAHCILAFL